jgi:hypothetical protein
VNILKPGTGTNYYYAKRHGEPIRNAVDCLGLSLCEDYRPTGASNSIDALEMLWKGMPEDTSRPSLPARPPAPSPTLAPAGPPCDYAYTYRGPHSAPATPLMVSPKNPLQSLTRSAAEKALQPSHGWSEEDSRRQLQAFSSCPGSDGSSITGAAFDQSHTLGNSSFSKGGWATGLTLASAATGLAGLTMVLSNPTAALALVGTAVAGAVAVRHLHTVSQRDHNDGQILRDMGTRIHQTAYNVCGERPNHHGNYPADFSR